MKNTRNNTESPGNTPTSGIAEIKSSLSDGKNHNEKASVDVLPEIRAEKKDAVDLLRAYTLQMSEKFDYYIDKTVATIKDMKKEIKQVKQEIQQLREKIDFLHDRNSQLKKYTKSSEIRQFLEWFMNQIFNIDKDYKTSPGFYSQLSTFMLEKIRNYIKGLKAESTKAVKVKLLITNPNPKERNRQFQEVIIYPNPNFPWNNFDNWLTKNKDIVSRVKKMTSNFRVVNENGKPIDSRLSVFQESNIDIHRDDRFTDKGYETITDKDARFLLEEVIVKFFSSDKILQKMKIKNTYE